MSKTPKLCAYFFLALAIPPQLAAQIPDETQATSIEKCRENSNRNNGTYDANGNLIAQRESRFCEVREVTIPRRSLLVVAAGLNGDVTISGWDEKEIRVFSIVRAAAATPDMARAVAKSVNINTADNQLKAEGPGQIGLATWSVSYEISVPVHTDLRVTSTNGSVAVDRVDARIELQSANGTLSLANVNGDVHANTFNGGLSLSLTGDRWTGKGLEATSLNGPVDVVVAPGYSASLQAYTTTGHLISDLTDASSTGSRSFAKRLGAGGPVLRLSTVNGPVSVKRK